MVESILVNFWFHFRMNTAASSWCPVDGEQTSLMRHLENKRKSGAATACEPVNALQIFQVNSHSGDTCV